MNGPRRWNMPPARRAFTMMEMLLVISLMAFLAYLVSEASSGFGKPMGEIFAESTIAQEANLAVASLTADLAGSLPDDRTGGKDLHRFVARTQPKESELWLCFDGGASPNGLAEWMAPDVVITYQVQSGALIRTNQDTGTTFVVARHVESLAATDEGYGVEIQLTFNYHNITRTYTLFAVDP